MHDTRFQNKNTMSRKAFLHGRWFAGRGEDAPDVASTSPEPWPVPPELRGAALAEEARRLGITDERLGEEALARAVMQAMLRP